MVYDDALIYEKYDIRLLKDNLPSYANGSSTSRSLLLPQAYQPLVGAQSYFSLSEDSVWPGWQAYLEHA